MMRLLCIAAFLAVWSTALDVMTWWQGWGLLFAFVAYGAASYWDATNDAMSIIRRGGRQIKPPKNAEAK